MYNIAVYPGSFHCITNGHIDLLERALKIFDKIIIAIAANPGKDPLFSPEERMDMIKVSLDGPSFEGPGEGGPFPWVAC